MTDERRKTPSAESLPIVTSSPAASPGRLPATARVAGRPQMVFRVESAEAAQALAGALGARDRNGVAAGADAVVQRAAGSSGAPLPSTVRDRFESSLGADLSAVRVHTGAASADAASAVGARAYTTGNDIHFAAGQYAPHDPFGIHLLAHEVAHTVQQSGGAPTTQYKLEVSSPGDAAEIEADRAADAMTAGTHFAIGAGAASSLARQATAGAGAKKPAGDLAHRADAVAARLQKSEKHLTNVAGTALNFVKQALARYSDMSTVYGEAKTTIANQQLQLAAAQNQPKEEAAPTADQAIELTYKGCAFAAGKVAEVVLEELAVAEPLAGAILWAIDKGIEAGWEAGVEAGKPKAEPATPPPVLQNVELKGPADAVQGVITQIEALLKENSKLLTASGNVRELTTRIYTGTSPVDKLTKAVTAIEAASVKCDALDAKVDEIRQASLEVTRQAIAQLAAAKESAVSDLKAKMGLGSESAHGDAKHLSAMDAVGQLAVVVSPLAPVGLVKVMKDGKPGEMFEAVVMKIDPDAETDPPNLPVGTFRRVVAQNNGTLVLDVDASAAAKGLTYAEPKDYLADEKNSPGDDYHVANVPGASPAGFKVGWKKND